MVAGPTSGDQSSLSPPADEVGRTSGAPSVCEADSGDGDWGHGLGVERTAPAPHRGPADPMSVRVSRNSQIPQQMTLRVFPSPEFELLKTLTVDRDHGGQNRIGPMNIVDMDIDDFPSHVDVLAQEGFQCRFFVHEIDKIVGIC